MLARQSAKPGQHSLTKLRKTVFSRHPIKGGEPMHEGANMTAINYQLPKSLNALLSGDIQSACNRLIAIAEPTTAVKLRRRLMRMDEGSSTILASNVLAYLSATRPTISDLYNCYCAELRRWVPPRDIAAFFPIRVSQSTFRRIVRSLDIGTVVLCRHGRHEAQLVLSSRKPGKPAKM